MARFYWRKPRLGSFLAVLVRRLAWLAGFVFVGGLLALLVSYPVERARRETTPLGLLLRPQAEGMLGSLTIAETLDRYGDEVSGLAPEIERAESALTAFALEIVPFFQYEDITPATHLPPVRMLWYPADRNFHTAGSYLTLLDTVTINLRFFNPFAPRWYHSVGVLSVLVHELGHSQGVLPKAGIQDPAEAVALMEATNQLATLEVLAAMTRDGNVYALPAFIREMQGFAADYGWSIALEAGREKTYTAYVERVANTAYGIASYHRAVAHWADDLDQLKHILKAYGRMPYTLLVEALRDPDYLTRELPYLPNESHRLKMDDTAYVLEHLDELVRDYAELLQTYGYPVEEGQRD